jgi:hypothetical protein
MLVRMLAATMQYGVREHHYAIVNNRVVIFHPHTRRVIHVYD